MWRYDWNGAEEVIPEIIQDVENNNLVRVRECLEMNQDYRVDHQCEVSRQSISDSSLSAEWVDRTSSRL
jgi:hypothetical protein